MKAKVFYFTGTGNSLIAAKKIANGIGASLEPIVKYQNEELVKTTEDVIGIVFPVYLALIYGVPEIVRNFLCKLEYDKKKYFFIVCTYGGYAAPNAFPTIKNSVQIAKSLGGNIDGRFYVRFPMNNLDYGHIPVPIETDSSVIIKKADVKIKQIIGLIKRGKKGNNFTQTLVNYTLGVMLGLAKESIIKFIRGYAKENRGSSLTYHQLVHLTDKSIEFYGAKCNGCGLCEKVCPVNNIKIENAKPKWLHKCEMCFACDEWCKQKAIHHWSKTKGKDYHHPCVNANDIMAQKL